MVMTVVILLGFILIVLVLVLVTLAGISSEATEAVKRLTTVIVNLSDSNQLLSQVVDPANNMDNNIESIKFGIKNVLFQLENLEKCEIKKALEALESMDSKLDGISHDQTKLLERILDELSALGR